MKTIGLLGGMSWESSIEYYRIINAEARARLGGTHSAECVMYSFDFARIEALQRAGDWEQAGHELATAARGIESAGADFLVVCTNTMHRLADAIAEGVSIPILHIADTTAAAVITSSSGRPLLLGTAYTMEAGFYAGRMRTEHGIDVAIPEAADRAVIHRVIYDELVRGVVSLESKTSFLEIIEQGLSRGCDGVIAGCTEIELLIGQDDLDVPLFPTARLHALAAVDLALS